MSEKVPVPNVTEVSKKDFAKMTETAALSKFAALIA